MTTLEMVLTILVCIAFYSSLRLPQLGKELERKRKEECVTPDLVAPKDATPNYRYTINVQSRASVYPGGVALAQVISGQHRVVAFSDGENAVAVNYESDKVTSLTLNDEEVDPKSKEGLALLHKVNLYK